jgi:GAF domain-containing protein
MRVETASDKRAGKSTLQVWRTNTLNVVLIVVAIVTPFALGNTVIGAIPEPGQWPAAGAFVLCYVLVVVMAIFRRIDLHMRAGSLLLAGYAAGAMAFARGGLAGDGRVYIMALPSIAFILIGVRTGVVTTILSLLMFAAFSLAADQGLMAHWLIPRYRGNPLTLADWMQSGLNVFMMLVPLALLSWRFIRFHENTLDAEQRATAESARASQLARERAAELEDANALLVERAEALTAATAVTRQVASLTDEQSLTEQFARLVAEHLKLDNVNVFLLDAQQKYAVLRATAFETPMRTAPQGHQVLAGSGDPVGKASQGIEALISPASPHTAGESLDTWRIALPLQSRGETLGALDIYFKVGQTPSQERIQALRTLADQLAISLKNVRLLQEVQHSLEAEREARGELSRQAWQELLRTYGQVGFLRNKEGVRQVTDVRQPDVDTVLQAGQPALDESDPTRLTVPILARNQVIGVIEARKPKDAAGWTAENMLLIEAVVEQLGVALESARLYQDTQHRATREQALSQMTAHFSRTLDMDTLLQTAVRELGQLPHVTEVSIHTVPPDVLPPANEEDKDGSRLNNG